MFICPNKVKRLRLLQSLCDILYGYLSLGLEREAKRVVRVGEFTLGVQSLDRRNSIVSWVDIKFFVCV